MTTDDLQRDCTIAQPPRWQQVGAWLGGTVSVVAISPRFDTDRLVLAATAAGVYRSGDGGRSWTPAPGLADPGVQLLAFAPLPAGNGGDGLPALFAATYNGRLYCSPNGGTTWTEVSAWAGLGVISAMAISPNFAEDHTLFVATDDGVFRSMDGGESWQSANFGLWDLNVLCIACTPDFVSRETLWAGTEQGGLFRSRNAARAWRDSGMGLPDSAIQCLAVSPAFAEDRTLFVGTETAGVYVSVDGGASWQPAGRELAEHGVNCLALSPRFQTSGGDTGYRSHSRDLLAGTTAGIYRSEDGGAHWTLAAGGEIDALSIAFATEKHVIATAYREGVFLSRDGGRSWQRSVDGLAAHAPPLVIMSPRQELYAVDLDGCLVRSRDRGATWQTHEEGLNDQSVRLIAVDGDEDKVTLFAVTHDGLYRRYETGSNHEHGWQAIAMFGEASGSASLLALSPDFRHDSTFLMADETGRLYLSADAGDHWHVLASAWDGENLLHTCFAPGYPRNRQLIAISAAQDEQGHVRIQVWESLDNGESWQNLAVLTTEIPAVMVAMPEEPEEQPLFLATQHRVIKVFQDGNTLAVEQHFFAEETRITAMVASPNYVQDCTLFVATNHGVYRSQDGGVTWDTLGNGLAGRAVVALLPSLRYAEDGQVYAITLGGAVWWWQPGE